MNEAQFQAYRELVDKLLECPSGGELEILKAHLNLLNVDFVEVIKGAAKELESQKNQNDAYWLETFAVMLSGFIDSSQKKSSQDYLGSLNQVLQAYDDKLLETQPQPRTLDEKLNELPARVLRSWGKATLSLASSNWQICRRIALMIENLCDRALKVYQSDCDTYQLEIAIAGYETILPIFIEADEHKKIAKIQTNLGYAYPRRKFRRARDFEKAIKYLQDSLQRYEKIYKLEEYPERQAIIQDRLGYAYRHRIYEDNTDNLDQAIKCYEEALQVDISEYSPEEKAEIYISLGISYKKRIRGNKEENLKDAINCYKQALNICIRSKYPDKWARIQHALGKAHYNLGIVYFYNSRLNNEDNFLLAIQYYYQSLEVRKRESNPIDWARVQHSLGDAYSDTYKAKEYSSDEKKIYFQQAINCYKKSLEVYTEENYPYEWAQIHKSLGNAYKKLVRESKSPNYDNAIACYKKALTILTERQYPSDCADVCFYLGLNYLEAKNLPESYEILKNAIEIVELLRDEILSDDDIKRNFAETWNKLYRCMVEVCVEQGRSIEAIQYVEASKARSLVELILNRNVENLFPLFPPAKVQGMKKINAKIIELQYKIKNNQFKNRDVNELVELRRKRYLLLDEIIGISGSFEFNKFKSRSIVDNSIVFVQFYITQKKLIVFIFTSTSSEPEVLDFSKSDVEKLKAWEKSYFQKYDKQVNLNNPELQNLLENKLHKLAQILHLDEILNKIPENYQTLILVPHQSLHLLPLHALPISTSSEEKNYLNLIDKFPGGVFYIPSCQLYRLVKERKNTEYQRFFAIKTLYEKDLGVIEAIGKLFTDPIIFKNDNAKKSIIIQTNEENSTIKIDDKLKEADCILFFCHGKFEKDKPLDSRLELNDGSLTLEDVIRVDFQLKEGSLVTLAACETGLKPRLDIGDEHISLSYGFLLACSSNVVSSLWMVTPYATALLVVRFYEEMKGNKIASSLNKAQSWLRTSNVSEFRAWLIKSKLSEYWKIDLNKAFNKFEDEKGADFKPFASPYYWAAFRLIGKGE